MDFNNKIQVNDVVLIKNPAKTILFWMLGRVFQLFQGNDGNMHSAQITRGDASYENHNTAPVSHGTFFWRIMLKGVPCQKALLNRRRLVLRHPEELRRLRKNVARTLCIRATLVQFSRGYDFKLHPLLAKL